MTNEQLRAIVERIETQAAAVKLEQEVLKEIYAEAKGEGYCVKTLKALVSLRKLSPDDREHNEAILETYKAAVGL